MKINDLLKTKGGNVITVNQNRSVYDAIKVLFENKIGAVLVNNDNEDVIGIISERDILRECYRDSDKLKDVQIKDVMTRELIVGEPEDEISYVKQVMIENRIRHLPVIDNDKLTGILSMRDIVEAELTKVKLENRQLKELIKGKKAE